MRNQFLSLEFVRLAHKELTYEQHKIDGATGAGAEEKSASAAEAGGGGGGGGAARGRASLVEEEDTRGIAKSMVEMTYPGASAGGMGLHARDDAEANFAKDPEFPNMG